MDNDKMSIGYLIMTEVNGYKNIAPMPYVYESEMQATNALDKINKNTGLYDNAYIVMVKIWKR